MAYIPPLPPGQATMANSSPVVISSDQSAVPASQSGTWNITNVSGTVSLPTGAATAAKQPALGTAGSASADVITIQGIASMTPISISGTITASNISGDVASGSSDSGNPVKIGGQARTTNPTAVTDGQRVNGIFDKLGKQVMVNSIRELKGVQQTTITSSTAETTVVSAVASTFLDVYGVIITNTSATFTKVTFKDSTAGTTRFVIDAPPQATSGFMLTESGAVPQATVNNNWTATCGTSANAIEITMLYVKNT